MLQCGGLGSTLGQRFSCETWFRGHCTGRKCEVRKYWVAFGGCILGCHDSERYASKGSSSCPSLLISPSQVQTSGFLNSQMVLPFTFKLLISYHKGLNLEARAIVEFGGKFSVMEGALKLRTVLEHT